jgi:hypothetical protein
MKKSIYLTLALTFIAGAALAKADDMTITIKKSSDSVATVASVPDNGKSCKVPIAFDSGASWDDVKDSYTVSSDTSGCLIKKTETISIGSDGTATFHKKK